MIIRNILYLSALYAVAKCARILHVMPFTGKSHYIAQKDLSLELAKRGHDVYVITPYKEKTHPPTYHQILVDDKPIWNQLFDVRPNVFDMAQLTSVQFQKLLYHSGFHLNDLVFNSSSVQKFMKEQHKFDLVINEVFFQESLFQFAHKYQAPHVLLTTFGNSFKTNYFSGNPLQLSTLYHEYAYSEYPFSFIGRLKNLFYCMSDLFWLKFWYLPRQEEYVRKYFTDLPAPVPSLEELAANVSLVLMNSHFSIDTPAAYLPNFIEVAGLNLKEPKPLPKDLQSLIDKAMDGVVYMSFGSNVQTKELFKTQLDAFFKVFSKINCTVLMKYEDLANKPENVPSNVILREWFPQRDVLAHPKIRLFIGHGGFLGLQESVSSGVPILGFPVFGDQYGNLIQAKLSGYGEMLSFSEINEENLGNLVNKILNEERYIKTAREIAKRYHDRPMNGLDTAVWWIEYVIRHKGADFMKSPTLTMSFISSNMIDCYLFILGVILVVIGILKYFISKLIGTKKSRKSKKD